MDQQLPLANIITLGVRDFARTREFYRQLGWPHAFDSDTFTVFEMRGALLALFGVDQLGTDARATPESGHGGIRSSVIITADRPEDVDALVRRAQAAGATVTTVTLGVPLGGGPAGGLPQADTSSASSSATLAAGKRIAARARGRLGYTASTLEYSCFLNPSLSRDTPHKNIGFCDREPSFKNASRVCTSRSSSPASMASDARVISGV